MSEIFQIITLTLMVSIVFILSLFGWKKLWFDRFGGKKFLNVIKKLLAELPIFKFSDHVETRMYARTSTLSVFISLFRSVVDTLDMEYWVTHCGTDGYLYLLF